ncbi:MAG TPA: alpha/beta fold hydrolase [Alphaproteobacteria bacterium]|nr:alpha/beta fold hydrolase [Alphaproteobacteria bacterium]
MTFRNIYAIPGWGFKSSVFKQPLIRKLDYYQLSFDKLEDYAHFLVSQLEDNATLIGWSFGGLIAIKITSLYPNKVKKLLLITSQPCFVESPNWQGIDQTYLNIFLKSFSKYPLETLEEFLKLVAFPTKNPEFYKYLKSHLAPVEKTNLKKQLNILKETDLKNEYKSLKCEIVHLMGKHDHVLKQNEKQLKSLNPLAQTIFLKERGHAGFLLSKTLKELLC